MKTRFIFFASLLCYAGILLAECSITDITACQRWPWNGLVDITYNVVCNETDSSGKPLQLRLEFSGYDALRDSEVTMTTLSGDGIDQPVGNGGPYLTTWNAGTDCPNFATGNFRVKIKAYTTQEEPSVTVDSVEISGAARLNGSEVIPYTLLVNWSDGTQTTVSPAWSITSGNDYASVDSATGNVTPNNSTGLDQTVELTATCEINKATYTETVTLTIAGNRTYLVVNLLDGSHRYSGFAPDPSNDTCRSTELWLRQISAGTFTMGSPEEEIGRYSNEDLHQVTLTNDYYIGVFEITQHQWQLLMETNPSFCQGDDYATRPVECVSYDMIRGTGRTAGAGWPSSGHAVDSASFMGVLRNKTGLAFDLPTEAQWEYASRGGKTTALHTGKNLTAEGEDANMAEVGRYWYNGGSNYSQTGDTTSGTAAAGSYLPNEFGLYDMHGNAWEWCLDWYSEHLGTENATDPVGPNSGSYRLLRSGSWLLGALNCRSAARGYNLPNCDGFFGLRVVCPDSLQN